MADYHELVEALNWLLLNRLQKRNEYMRGLLGDGQGRVQVPERSDYSYVRPDRYTTRVFEIFNKRVAGPDGMPVLIGELPWQPNLTQVVAVDWDAYLGVGWGDAAPGLPYHGRTHEWRNGAPGVDTFNIYIRQLAELKTYPVGSGSTSINVSAYNFNHLGDIKSWPGALDFDLSPAIPIATGTARFILAYWDPASGTAGNLGVATGTLGVDAPTEDLDKPSPPAGSIPSAWIRLAGGQRSIDEFDIWDARMPWAPSIEFGTGTGGVWAGLIPIGDPGGNFTGSTIEAALQELSDGGGGGWPFSGKVITVAAAADADFATLAAAVADSGTTAGDVILLSPEMHVVEDVALPDGVHMLGFGLEATRLQASSQPYCLRVGDNSQIMHMAVENFHADAVAHAIYMPIAAHTSRFVNVKAEVAPASGSYNSYAWYIGGDSELIDCMGITDSGGYGFAFSGVGSGNKRIINGYFDGSGASGGDDINNQTGTTTLIAPILENNQIDTLLGASGSRGWFFANNGILISVGGSPIQGQSDSYPNIGSAATAEKMGNIYAAANKDIFLNDDDHGLASRLIDTMGIASWTVHFRVGETTGPGNGSLLNFSWAGSPFSTPGAATWNQRGSWGRWWGSAGSRSFMYESKNPIGSYINFRIALSTGSDFGMRIDDGTDDNYYEYKVVMSGASMILRLAQRTGGGSIVNTDVVLYPNRWDAILSLQAQDMGAGSHRPRIFVSNELGTRAKIATGATVNWVPTRVGLVQEGNTAANFDWFYIP